MHPVLSPSQYVAVQNLEEVAHLIASEPMRKVDEGVCIAFKEGSNEIVLKHALWTTGEKTAALFLTTMGLLEGCLSMEIFQEPSITSRVVEERQGLEHLTKLVEDKIEGFSVFKELKEKTCSDLKTSLTQIQQNILAIVQDIESVLQRTPLFVPHERPLDASICQRFHLLPELCQSLNVTLLFYPEKEILEGVDVSLGFVPSKAGRNSLETAMTLSKYINKNNPSYPDCFHTYVSITARGNISQGVKDLEIVEPKRAFHCMVLYYSLLNPPPAQPPTEVLYMPSSLKTFCKDLIEQAQAIDQETVSEVKMRISRLLKKTLKVEDFLSQVAELLKRKKAPSQELISDIKDRLSKISKEP